MPNVPSEKSGKKQINLNLRVGTVEKFREVCKSERRNLNEQFEIIFEEWLKQRELENDPIYKEWSKTPVTTVYGAGARKTDQLKPAEAASHPRRKT